jgi:tripartite-type tricarboxylate transporter receptor subunit TctC
MHSHVWIINRSESMRDVRRRFDSQRSRRGFLASVLACVFASPCAAADELPNRQIRIIVPLAAGSSLDARARIIAHALGERLKQQPIVENKPGAGGSIGAAYVAKAPADGATLLFTNDSVVINPHVYRDAGYDALKDLAPITQAYISAMVLVAYPGFKATSVKDLIAVARKEPGAVTYGSSGNGGLPHLSMEVFNRGAGIRMLHIPYKGDSQALTDIIAGRVAVMVSGIPAALPQIRSGSLRALGVTTAQRVHALADIPTVAEAGLPGYDMYAWTGFFAPARTPKGVIERLNRELTASLQSEAVQAHLEGTGGRIAPSSAAQFGQFVQKEFERYGKLVKDLGLRID